MQALVVDARVPTPEHDGGSLRMVRLLSMLSRLCEEVTFAASHPLSWPPFDATLDEDMARLSGMGVRVISGASPHLIEEHLSAEGGQYDLVWLSGGAYVATKHMENVRRYAPLATLLYDTVDLTFLREYRHAKLTGSARVLQRALASKQRELALIREADSTVVVSEAEKAVLSSESLGARIEVLPSAHEPHKAPEDFGPRGGIISVGAFQHLPNVDGILYYVEQIHPLVKAELPGVKLYVIGNQPPPEVLALQGDDILVLGHVPDIAACFARCRLSIAPLRFGAGIKTKVLMSMSYGVPVVATSVSAEGIGLQHRHNALIGDDARAFSEAVRALYTDEGLWKTISRNGLQLVRECYSPPVIEARLATILTSVTRRGRT